MRADESDFLLSNDLHVDLDGDEFFARKWEEKVERNYV